jgi:formate transporter
MMEDDRRTDERLLDPAVFDAYAPPEIARRVEKVGVTKANMEFVPLATLSVLAGAFIAFGAMLYTVVMTDSGLGLGPARLLGGISFSLGLVLVLVGGAELFTGNALIVMGWADRKVSTMALLRNWLITYVGNFIGAIAMVVLVYWSGLLEMGNGAVGSTAIGIASGKVGLAFDVALVRGVLCNILVCLAVWLCFAAHSVTAKILAIVFPVTAFVALGFEHSIANMYFIPIGILAALESGLAVPGKPRSRRFSHQPDTGNDWQHRRRRCAGGAHLLCGLPARQGLNARAFAEIPRAPIIRGAAKAQK